MVDVAYCLKSLCCWRKNMRFNKILDELRSFENVFDNDDYRSVVTTVSSFFEGGKIIGLGAGRMGYSLRAFIMRLSHIGFNASMIGDTNVPRCDENTLCIVNSSSGNTDSI